MEFGEVSTFVTAAAFLHAFSFTIFIYAVYEPVCVYFMNAYVDLCYVTVLVVNSLLNFICSFIYLFFIYLFYL